MNTEQKLTKIREKCVELLAIAEKRTRGNWNTIESEGDYFGDTLIGLSSTYEGWQDDCTFIASCAGPAEAGWKATISAIDLLTDNGSDYVTYEQESQEIISAWEGLV